MGNILLIDIVLLHNIDKENVECNQAQLLAIALQNVLLTTWPMN
jgi:hypothetical protein